jgi:hypothetical protein
MVVIGTIAVGFGPLTALIAYLAVYTVAGALLAFNVAGVSDRLARHYSTYPRILRYFGRDKPGAWRAGGLMMLPFGVLLSGWLFMLAIRAPIPHLDRGAAAAVLVVVGCLGIGAYAYLRRRVMRAR